MGAQGPLRGPRAPHGAKGPPKGRCFISNHVRKTHFSNNKFSWSPRRKIEPSGAWATRVRKMRTLRHTRTRSVNPSAHKNQKCEPFGAQGRKMRTLRRPRMRNTNPPAPEGEKREPFGARGRNLNPSAPDDEKCEPSSARGRNMRISLTPDDETCEPLGAWATRALEGSQFAHHFAGGFELFGSPQH